MKIIKAVSAVLFLSGSIALAGCNTNSTTPTPSTTNVAGQYSGTIQDSVLNSAPATATLNQSGRNVTGTMTIGTGVGAPTGTLALTLSNSNSLTGTMNLQIGSVNCTFNTTGQYSTSSYVWSGNYTAQSGCNGETGTFTMTEQCSLSPGSSGQSVDRARPLGLKPC